MFKQVTNFIFTIAGLFLFQNTHSQNLTEKLIIDTIIIEGAHRTKSWIILREIHVQNKDTILFEKIKYTIDQIKNDLSRLGIFSTVNVSFVLNIEKAPEIIFIISVIENWYLYPSIVFEIADRNYNVWGKEFNYSLARTNIGFRIFHSNTSGRRDESKVVFHTGYTRKIELHYDCPFISAESKFGGSITLFFTDQKELGIQTKEDKVLFYKDEDKVLLNRAEARIQLYYRSHLRWFNEAGIRIRNYKLNQQTAEKFPDYFLNSETKQKGISIFLKTQYNSLNHPIRPTKGVRYSGSILTDLLGNQRLNYYGAVGLNFTYSNTIFRRLSFLTIFDSRMAIDRKIRPYNNIQALGYGNNILAGYSLYVIDGLDYVLNNNLFRCEIIEFKKKLFSGIFKKGMMLKATIDLTLSADIGYVNNPFVHQNNYNTLPNSLIMGSAAGSAITINDIFQITGSYQINKSGEHGFFIQTKTAF